MGFFQRGQLPLLILKLLDEHEEMYGYEIRQAVSRLTNGKFELKEGTLYPLLHGFEDQNYVTAEWRFVDGAHPRKYYRLTPDGRKFFRGETRAMNWFTALLKRQPKTKGAS